MFKNRDVTVKIGKKATEDNGADKQVNDQPLEDRIRKVVKVLESPAKKLFAGICIYVLLDTIRQVEIAKANHPTPES